MPQVIVAKNCKVCGAEPVCYGSIGIGCPCCDDRKVFPDDDDGTYEDAIIKWNEINE
mgnify:FL=1